MNYQKIILVGNVTKDAKRQTSKKGDVHFTTFSLAVSDGRDSATYFPIVAFGKLGEVIAKYVTNDTSTAVAKMERAGWVGTYKLDIKFYFFGFRIEFKK